jgi:hypothetical protein
VDIFLPDEHKKLLTVTCASRMVALVAVSQIDWHAQAAFTKSVLGSRHEIAFGQGAALQFAEKLAFGWRSGSPLR